MVSICPTVTATEPHTYRDQIERVAPLAARLHIDLMDGDFVPTKSPGLDQIWWPVDNIADIHLMYRRPADSIAQLLKLRPNLVIIHNEAEVHHMEFAALLHREGIKSGLAILQTTPIEHALQIMHSFDHILIFSGHLGFQGGKADLDLLDKVKYVRLHHPAAEIGWDGGINAENIKLIVDAGVTVLNIGGYIQRAQDPQKAFADLTNKLQ